MPTRRNINQNPKEKGHNPNSNPFEALSDEEEHFGMYETLQQLDKFSQTLQEGS